MKKTARRVLPALVLALAGCAGGAASGLDDAGKRARIDAMYAEYRQEFPDVEAISAAELARRLDGDDPPVVVDVRTDEERQVSMIPGAISQQEFERHRDELAGREVVTYCTIGYRSGLYAEELLAEGWKAENLAGSILAWTHAGLPLVHDGEPTRRVHVYGERWNLAASGYDAVW